ncbi:MAG: hypothetical protein GX963_05800 [Bacteroidales bacterium]|nr:hypothetical protein [Bacteroidales bacterium]
MQNLNYITLTEMADGFSEYNLPQTSKLVGKSMDIYLDDGNILNYHFKSKDKLVYLVKGGEDDKLTEEVSYIATEPKDQFFYFSYIHKKEVHVSIVLDYKRNIATVIFGVFPNDETDTLPIFKRVMADMPAYASQVFIHNASIDTPYTAQTPKHEFTYELAGKNATYTYSAKDAYIHTYYDVDLFNWYCYSGNEKGLGDMDYVKFLKLDDNFYMIIWVEKILHVISTITLNFDTNRSSGSMASYEGKDYQGEILNVPSGAIIEVVDGVNVTKLKPGKLNK